MKFKAAFFSELGWFKLKIACSNAIRVRLNYMLAQMKFKAAFLAS